MRKNILYFFMFFSIFFTSAISYSHQTVKAVVFDFGGVVATYSPATIIHFFSETFHITQEELPAEMVKWKTILSNGEKESDWKTYAKSRGMTLPENFGQALEKATESAFSEIPETIALVKSLQKRGYITAMLSNATEYHAHVMEKLWYFSLFKPALMSCKIGAKKPEKEAFQILLDTLNLSPAAVIFIDDKKANVEAASAMGIDAIEFISPKQLTEELSKRNL